MILKKILLLGGSAQQVVAIEKAKELGFYTVLCDFLPDNPGQFSADKFYLVSTTDKDAVLAVAKKENIGGVLAYASDPAAPTAAYVAEKLHLPTNPYKSVDILCNKDKFRAFLSENGFSTPRAKSYTQADEAVSDIKNGCFKLPVIIKPTDSSGSKGVSVLYKCSDLESAVDFSFSYSRANRIIVEEFIEKKHKYLIGGDVFIDSGKVILWGLMNCHRDNNANTLVPVGKSYPLLLDDADIASVKFAIQKLVDKLHIQFGCMNIEAVVDKNGKVWLIDVGPRAGGNMIPDILGMIFNVDLVTKAVKAAMGCSECPKQYIPNGFYATHNLHTNKDGIYKTIKFSDNIEKYIIRKEIYKKQGDIIEYFDNAAKALGVIFMRFSSCEEMFSLLDNINNEYTLIYNE